MLRRKDEEVGENSVACGLEGSKAQERVQFVISVNKDEGWLSLGVGDVILDSAADESCWPVGRREAFPTKESPRKVLLKIANGGDMQHYGLQEVFFKCNGSENKDWIGLKFQVIDVRKFLLVVRRLMEKASLGNRQRMEQKSCQPFLTVATNSCRVQFMLFDVCVRKCFVGVVTLVREHSCLVQVKQASHPPSFSKEVSHFGGFESVTGDTKRARSTTSEVTVLFKALEQFTQQIFIGKGSRRMNWRRQEVGHYRQEQEHEGLRGVERQVPELDQRWGHDD